MPPVQTVSNKATGTITALPTGIAATAAGSCLVAYVLAFGDSSSPTVITLTSGTGGTGGSFAADSWTAATTSLGGAGMDAGIWVNPNCAAGTNAVRITTDGSGTQTIAVIIEEWANLALTSVTDQVATPLRQSVLSTTWSAGPTGTTTQGNELIVACAASFNSSTSSFTLGTPGAPWTEETQVQQTSTGFYQLLAAGYQAVTSTGAFTYSGTGAYKATVCVATLKVVQAGVPAGLATGAATARNATVSTPSNISANAGLASAAGTAAAPAVTAATGTFPAKNLGIKVELLLNSVWTDITAYVYQRNPVQISGMGRADWTSAIQAAQLTLTLDNRTGRFSPKNSSGAYFPFVARNTQIRVSVNSQSVTGAAYAGYRFWGEVAEWPPRWDPSGRDVTSEVVAAGIWRRVSQLQTTLGSAFTRYTAITLTGASAPRSYWPMEDGSGSTQLVPYDSVAGTANATFAVLGTNAPSLAASTDFKGSDALVVLNGAAVTATVPAGGTATNNVTRMCLSVPVTGDSASGTTNWNLLEIDSAGTVAKLEVYLNFTGTLLMQGRNSGGTVVFSGTTTTNVKGVPVLLSCELTPSGGNVAWAMRVITQGAAGITESVTGTLASASVGAVSAVKISRANVLLDTAAGHLSVSYGAPSTMVGAAAALGGYAGEKAMDRFTRICGEMGIAAETTGAASATAAMGPQLDDHLADVLQTVEDTDCGLLFESRGQFGLGYRSNASMANQAAAAVLSYTAAVLDASLAPTYDDQLTRNNVTVTNQSTGYTQQAVLASGAMSVLSPPSGIGNGYAFTRTVSAASDSQVAGIATFLLNVGTVDEIRFPVLTLKMVRASNASLFAAIPGLRVGDYVQVTNPPSFLTGTTIRQLVWGYSETLNAREWTFALNTVPETPWETGFTPGTIQIAQIPGGSGVTSSAPGAGGTGGILTSGSITPAMLNEGITIHNLGGNAITISVSAPSAPNAGDIWIASATGLISQWNGSSWAPFKFDASATIQAATITAAQIVAHTITASQLAAGTITAAEIAAGIVIAGIVDATTITGASIIADGAAGEILAYSGTPVAGNLITSISGSAGSDRFANSYAAGIEIQSGGLILDNQGSAPPAVTGASSIYSSVAGRPRYLSSAGSDSVIERSAVNVSQFTVGNTGTFTQISADLGYLANEGNQSSEYEIEIRGNGVGNTTSPQTLTFQLYVDGVLFGGGATAGATFFSSGATGLPNFRFTYNVVLFIVTSGAGGTATASGWGVVTPSGNSQPTGNCALTGLTIAGAFDTTANHTLELRAAWGSTATGQTLTTYRTKLGRRM